MCYPEIMNINTVASQTDFFQRERQNFKEEVSNHYWKKILGDSYLENRS